VTVALAEWKQAMSVELDNLEKQNAWKIINKPCGYRIIGSKWIFAVKRDNKGNIVRFKARLVAQGYG